MALFDQITDDIRSQGYSIQKSALPLALCAELIKEAHKTLALNGNTAGIGRQTKLHNNTAMRGDTIAWVENTTSAGQAWNTWALDLKNHLNSRLFLGLFSFESHYAHYPAGAFYQRHLDAFEGQKNRVLSLVFYLNKNWHTDDGGQLKLYRDAADQQGITVTPEQGTLAIFLSEDFPHEVLPASKDRYSIAGWFRVNTSNQHRTDPPV